MRRDYDDDDEVEAFGLDDAQAAEARAAGLTPRQMQARLEALRELKKPRRGRALPQPKLGIF